MSTPAKTREAVREKPPPNKQKHTMSRPTIGSQHHSIYNTQISLQRNNAITAPHLANTLWFPLPTNTSGVHVHPNSTSTPLQCIANILAPCSTDTPQVNPPANTSKVPPHTNKDTISPPIGTTIHYVDKLVFHYQWQPLVHSNGATNTGNIRCGSKQEQRRTGYNAKTRTQESKSKENRREQATGQCTMVPVEQITNRPYHQPHIATKCARRGRLWTIQQQENSEYATQGCQRIWV